MSLFFRACISLGFAILLFSSFPVNAVENYNSSRSNTAMGIKYPDTLDACVAAGGTSMIKGSNGFCIMEINTARTPTPGRPSPGDCTKAGGMVETKGNKQYCMPTEQELGSILKASPIMKRLMKRRQK